MSRLNVLVVGASVAGPSTAYWLARAGHTVTVVERFPELRKGGQAVDIRTTGVSILKRVPGLEAAVRAKRPPIDGWQMMSAQGKPYATFKPSGDPDKQSLISEYEIFRGDLNRILYDLTATRDNVKYVFDEQVASLTPTRVDGRGPLVVEFLNKHLPSTEYDLVVACDGAASRTRPMGLKCGPRDYIENAWSWAAFGVLNKDLLAGSGIAQGHSGVGGRMIAVGQDSISNSNRVFFQKVFPKDAVDPTRPFREAQAAGTDALKAFVAESFRDMGWRTAEILKLIESSPEFYASEWSQVKVPSLHGLQGRFALVGDSGYASGIGTGTTLAMTGAYILAGEIERHAGDLAAGLAAYEARMRPLVNDMQKIPPALFTMMTPQTRPGLWLRNSFMTVASRVNGLLAPLMGSAFASGSKYDLPEYEWKHD